MNSKLIENLLKTVIPGDCILKNEPLKNHLSFKAGGPADFLVTPKNKRDLLKLLGVLRENDVPFYLMGNGTNLLVRDGGYHGVIIKTKEINLILREDDGIVAEAGALLKDVANFALESRLSGMEFASGIPGTIGGAGVMNAGAYDGEIKKILEYMDILDESGTIRRLYNEDCGFSYRSSIIQSKPWYVLNVKLRLRFGDYNSIKEKMDKFNNQRKEKQPLDYPSAGSTFRRPEGYYAGKLIQDIGFKGYSVGGAMVSEKHCGFVINKGNATAKDIITLISEIQNNVMEQFGVPMKTEVVIIGDE